MKNIIKILIGIFVLFSLVACASLDSKPKQPRKIAVQMWSLHDVSLKEALEKLKGLDIDGVECYPNQKIGGKYPNVPFNQNITAEQKEYVKQLFKDNGLKMVSFGVAKGEKEDVIEALCKFVSEFGVKRIITEDRVLAFPLWQKYGEKYGITMCLHHHALDAYNQYYDTYVVNKYTAPYSRIKSNPDVGHWVRSNISAVQSIKDLKGNIGSIHIKDEDAYGKMDSKAKILGEGFVNIPEILKELDKQGYDGYFVIEYEDQWGKNVPLIKACVDYLRKN
ncbi:MAG: sugar phosphate isomerase/epimerase [Opitutales bacterium]|nr:sugar phosphate isomerase/epimerase [Opitutales bacterium]